MKEKNQLSKTEFGSTGISTTRIGLGLAALGRPGYINLGHAEDLKNDYNPDEMEKHVHTILDRAWQLGIRYFDAARSYGRAEQFLASWLHTRNIKTDEVTVGSKWGYTYTANWQVNAHVHEVKEHSIDVLQKQWQESKTHLAAHLKLYQIHSATIESGVLDNSNVLNTLASIKENNVAIGLSLSGTKQTETLEKAVSIEIDGIRLFDAVQATWNLLETSAGKVLLQARETGMGISIKESVANGRLTNRNNEKDFESKKKILSKIAREYNVNIDAIALASALKQPFTHIVLSGATTIEQLISNLKADELTNLPDIDIAEDADVYWAKRSALAWN